MRLTDKENKLVRGNETQGGSTKKKKSPMKRGENIGWVLNRHILVLSETRNWNCTTNVGCRRKVVPGRIYRLTYPTTLEGDSVGVFKYFNIFSKIILFSIINNCKLLNEHRVIF